MYLFPFASATFWYCRGNFFSPQTGPLMASWSSACRTPTTVAHDAPQLSAPVSDRGARRKKRNAHHGRISCRRYQLLRDKYLRVRQERSRRLAASSAPPKRGNTRRREARAPVICECCLETIMIDEYGDSPHAKCKECQRLLCSNCCFASEKAPLWYCRMCVVTKVVADLAPDHRGKA